MVFDIAINPNFEVFIDHRGDLATVDGIPGFEQSIVLHLTELFTDIINEFDEDTIIEMATVEAQRVTEEVDMAEAVAGFDIEFAEENPEKLLVTIIYDTGDISELEVEA